VSHHLTDRAVLNDLDGMIGRAEAACLRYRQAANEPGLGSLSTRLRQGNWLAMEKTLARLRAQRVTDPDR
jgi:hypothetical protein